MTLSSACFESNNIDGGDSLVSGDSGSTIEFTSTFGANNQAGVGATCQGVIDPFDGVCDAFNSTFCEAAVTKQCISVWEDLRTSIALSEALGQGGVFTICPESTINAPAFAPIEISSRNIIIRCGEEGERTENCVFAGGTLQFRVVDGAEGVEFQGLFFKGTSSAAIRIEGDTSSVAITDCVFFVSMPLQEACCNLFPLLFSLSLVLILLTAPLLTNFCVFLLIAAKRRITWDRPHSQLASCTA